MKILFTLLLLSLSCISAAQSPIGKWKTVDDNTGKERSYVSIFEKDGKLFGKIVALFPEEGREADPVCKECTDHRKGQKIVGLQMLENLEKDGNEWSGGEILDPENGKIYRCKIWLENNGKELKVRGYIAFFYRTQTWYKVD